MSTKVTDKNFTVLGHNKSQIYANASGVKIPDNILMVGINLMRLLLPLKLYNSLQCEVIMDFANIKVIYANQ